MQRLVHLLHKDQVVHPLSKTVNISNNTISGKFGKHFFQPGLNSVKYFPWRLNNTNSAVVKLYMVFLGINPMPRKMSAKSRKIQSRVRGITTLHASVVCKRPSVKQVCAPRRGTEINSVTKNTSSKIIVLQSTTLDFCLS